MTADCMFEALDYNGGDVLQERSNNPTECGNLCRQIDACKRWTFVRGPWSKQCYLNNQSSTSVASCVPCIAGFKNSGSAICAENGKQAKKENLQIGDFLFIPHCNLI